MKEAHNGTKPKSAPCTPCGNHDTIFDMDTSGNFDHSAVKSPNEVSYAGSTPKLHQAVAHTLHTDVPMQQQHYSLDRRRHRPAAVGCSPVEPTSQLRQNHADEVYPPANGFSRRHRRHRPRDRHRSANANR